MSLRSSGLRLLTEYFLVDTILLVGMLDLVYRCA